MTGHWREIDHTADLAIKVFGSDLRELFTTSAQGMFSLAFEPDEGQTQRQFTVKLTAPDTETLLIDWLNELLYLSEKYHMYFTRFDYPIFSPTALTARISGLDIQTTKQVIKATTFHNIAIDNSPEGYHTEIVFDL